MNDNTNYEPLLRAAHLATIAAIDRADWAAFDESTLWTAAALGRRAVEEGDAAAALSAGWRFGSTVTVRAQRLRAQRRAS